MKPANILSDTGYKASLNSAMERQLMRTIVFDRDITDEERGDFLRELSNFDEVVELCTYFRTGNNPVLKFGYTC